MRGVRAPHSVGVRPGATQPCTDSTDVTVCSPGISLLHDVNQTARFWPGGTLVSSKFGLSDLLRSRSGGARRDRTDDLLLAKQALSHLSYGPVSTLRPTRTATLQASIFEQNSKLRPPSEWWAWKDLNFRPHAYQARALTN